MASPDPLLAELLPEDLELAGYIDTLPVRHAEEIPYALLDFSDVPLELQMWGCGQGRTSM